MADRQLALFIDAGWVDVPRDTALGQLRDLTRNDRVHSYYQAAGSPVLRSLPSPGLVTQDGRRAPDPLLELALPAYLWLCEHYRDGTDLYLFGAGAGGIAALRLARLVAIAGLLRVPDRSLVENVLAWDAEIPRYPEELLVFRKEYSRTVRIRFTGLLDAAGPFSRVREIDFLEANQEWIADGRLNPILLQAFNALALDETSDLHLPIQWAQSRRTGVAKQVWFRGSHSDMGRAYSIRDNPLGLFPFERLATEATRRGLALRPGWKREIRQAQRSVTRWVTRERSSDTDRPRILDDAASLSDGGSRRPLGLVFGQEFDVSLSDPRIIQDIGAPPAGVQMLPTPEPVSPLLSQEEQTLFLLNDMRPPQVWVGDRRQDKERGEQVPLDDSHLQEVPEAYVSPSLRFPPEPISPRFLLAQFQQGREEFRLHVTRRLKPEQPTWLLIAIGPGDPEWLSALGSEAFSYEPPPRGKGDELTVVLSSWGEQPQIRHIVLPKRGRSTEAHFELEPMKRGFDFNARVTVLHRNRVLQSAVLHAPVGTSIDATLVVDAGLLEDLTHLRRRTPADLSLIINERPTGPGRALFVEGEVAREIAADASDPLFKSILDGLEGVAKDPEANLREPGHTKKVVLVRNLAVQGHAIYQFIQEALTAGSRKPQPPPWPLNIQIVAAHSAKVYPLEFVYDYPPPGATNPQVTMCPNWKKEAALEQGTAHGCYERCKLKPQGNYVCPNGFWGVKKVIERHAFHSGTKDNARLSSDGAQRKPLSLQGAAVLGVSQIVHQADSGAAAAILSSLQHNLQCNPAEPIKDWNHLKDLVSDHGPPLIVLLPHVQNTGPLAGQAPAAGGVYLEIENSVQRASEITSSHLVRDQRAPLVLFLGCKGAIRYSKYDNALDHFRRAGAAAVIAPAATVAPANVVQFVRDLAKALQQSLRKGAPVIGIALRDARRLQFMNGNLPALSIMGFGDGDLRLTLKE